MTILEVSNLSKSFGAGETEVKALVDITLNVKRGEFVAIMGASGSGKSTLLHLLGCLDNPNSGEIVIEQQRVNGLNDRELSLLRRRKIGFIFQFFNLIPVLTAEENVALPLMIDGLKKKQIQTKIDEALALVGLSHRRHHFPDELSGGEQQRVAIARALITKPSIILADEPTGNLDSITSEEIMSLLRQSCSQLQQTIILVTHDPKDAAFADRVIFLKDGRIVDQAGIKGKANAQRIVNQLQEVNDE